MPAGLALLLAACTLAPAPGPYGGPYGAAPPPDYWAYPGYPAYGAYPTYPAYGAFGPEFFYGGDGQFREHRHHDHDQREEHAREQGHSAVPSQPAPLAGSTISPHAAPHQPAAPHAPAGQSRGAGHAPSSASHGGSTGPPQHAPHG